MLMDALFAFGVVAVLVLTAWLIAPARPWRRRRPLESPAVASDEPEPTPAPVPEPEPMPGDVDRDLGLIEQHFSTWTRFVWGAPGPHPPDVTAFIRKIDERYWVFAVASDKQYAWAYVTTSDTLDPTAPTQALWWWAGSVPSVVRAMELLAPSRLGDTMTFPNIFRLPTTQPLIIRPERR